MTDVTSGPAIRPAVSIQMTVITPLPVADFPVVRTHSRRKDARE